MHLTQPMFWPRAVGQMCKGEFLLTAAGTPLSRDVFSSVASAPPTSPSPQRLEWWSADPSDLAARSMEVSAGSVSLHRFLSR